MALRVVIRVLVLFAGVHQFDVGVFGTQHYLAAMLLCQGQLDGRAIGRGEKSHVDRLFPLLS